MRSGALTRIVYIGPYLLAVFGFFVRAIGIGSLLPYVDEAANILTSSHAETRAIIGPWTLGRPLLAVLFYPAVYIQHRFLHDFSLIEVSRLYVSAAVLLTTVILIPVGRRVGGTIGAWVVALLWTLCPLSFLHGRLALQDPFSALFFAVVCGYIYLRPPRKGGRESRRELWLLIFAGGAAAFAVLNKITALFEVPWLLAAYVSEQRERKERLLSGSVTRRLAVCFAVVLGVLVSVIVQSSFERMVAFGRTSSAVEFAKILHGGMDGLSLVIKIMRGYLEEGFAVFVLLILLFLPLLRPQSALMCLGYIATFGVYCFGFGHFFSGRYLLTSLIPLSLLSAQAVDARWRYCGSGTSQISRWGSLKILPYLFSGGLFFCGLHWGKQLSTVLKDPLNNAYSSPAKASEWAPLRNDYEQYTVSAWASIGLDALRDVILDQLHSTKARQITLIGSPNFSPEVYVTRLLLLDNLRVGVVAADFNRWDFPFFVANCQRIAGPFRGGEDAEVVVVQLAPAEQSATGNPNVTDGFEAEAIREIPRSFLESRFRLYRAAPVKDEQLKKLAPRNGGRYPDGLVAPVFAEQVSIYGERGAQAIVISGVELLELERDKISVTVNGVEVPFVFEREEGRFRIVLHDALTPGEHNVRVFFGKWQMMLDPFEGGAAYPNIQRAVSARDVEVLQTRPALPIDPPPRTM